MKFSEAPPCKAQMMHTLQHKTNHKHIRSSFLHQQQTQTHHMWPAMTYLD